MKKIEAVPVDNAEQNLIIRGQNLSFNDLNECVVWVRRDSTYLIRPVVKEFILSVLEQKFGENVRNGTFIWLDSLLLKIN